MNNCDKCPFNNTKDIRDWLIFFRFKKMDKVKDYDSWKRFNILYEFLKVKER
jgi:hypothetical protein